MFAEISEDIILTIKELIEKKDNGSLKVQKTFQTYWLRNSETEFRISRLDNIQITISRVCFKNKRCGTMSEILEILKKYCMQENIKKIQIQSVETYEMMKFCLKHHLIPKNENIWINNVLIGDYELYIDSK